MKKIDFHSHYLSPGFVDHLAKHYNSMGDGIATPSWSVDDALEMMANQDIRYSLLSISSPQVHSDDATETAELAQEVNEFGRDFSRLYPDQLGFMASLPLPYIDESVKAVETAVKDDQATGFVLEKNSRGVYLGDSRLDPVMDALNTNHALIAIHPTQPNPITSSANQKTAIPLMEFFFDTTRAVANMSENRIFSRYPDITWIIPHAGALLPIIAQRITIGASALKQEVPRDDMMTIMGKVYFDVAGATLPYQLSTLLQMADPNRLLYGADYPYTPESTVATLAKQLDETDLVSPELKENIFFNNGQKLLATREIQVK